MSHLYFTNSMSRKLHSWGCTTPRDIPTYTYNYKTSKCHELKESSTYHELYSWGCTTRRDIPWYTHKFPEDHEHNESCTYHELVESSKYPNFIQEDAEHPEISQGIHIIISDLNVTISKSHLHITNFIQEDAEHVGTSHGMGWLRLVGSLKL